jgi:hypothetical protein
MSHVYSFFTISSFLFVVRRYFVSLSAKNLWASALFLGLSILIRPVNILVVAAVPFLADNYTTLHQAVSKTRIRQYILLAVILLVTLLPQFLINHIQTGHLWVWGYQGEGFVWARPHIKNFLFSFRKGWFIYTPFMVLLLPAMFCLFQRSKYSFFTFSGFFILVIYVFSSWWNWFYGDSFGMRPMVDFYALFFLVIALMIRRSGDLLKIFGILWIGITMALNLIQTWQFKEGIIHADSMDRESYRYVFLKTADKYRNVIGAKHEPYWGKQREDPVISMINDFEENYPDWVILDNAYADIAYRGARSLIIDGKNPYSAGLNLPTEKLQSTGQSLYAEFSTWYYEPGQEAARNAFFLVNIFDRDKLIFYKSFRLKSLPDPEVGIWRASSAGFSIPVDLPEEGTVRFYIWNKDGAPVFLDNMEVRLYEILAH